MGGRHEDDPRRGARGPRLSRIVQRLGCGEPPWAALCCVLAALLAGCTYGPEEDLVRIHQVVRLGDSYRALVLAQHDVVRRPTGLSTFPDGGAWRYVRRRGLVYLIDAEARVSRALATYDAPDALWESFAPWLAGLEGDTVVYVRLTGCPRGGQCHAALLQEQVMRHSLEGETGPVASIPEGVGLPGVMIARRPGEQHFVRFGTQGDTITARFVEDGPYERLFRIRPDGSAEIIGDQ